MKFSTDQRDLTKIKTDLLVVNVSDGKVLAGSFADKVDKKLGGLIRKTIKKENFKGALGSQRVLSTGGKIAANSILIVGLGPKAKFDLEATRRAAAVALKVANQIQARHITTAAHGGHIKSQSKLACAQATVEGMSLAAYQFSRYKKAQPLSVKQVAVLCPSKASLTQVKKGITRGSLTARGTLLARDLVNTPARDMTALALAKIARSLKGIRTRVFNKAQIKKMKMEAFLGVNLGSDNPPAFIEMHYRPKGKIKKKVVLVGKGVTFDSGGLSLKPAKGMETMKDDMAGSAGVIGLMSIIAGLKPQTEVWGLVAATDNMPDGRAQKPGDVVKAMNGKTIEVLNTDAEGRLTMADALSYGCKKKPDIMIDMATLTGACLVALGERYSGLMSNNDKLVEQLTQAGLAAGEKLWRLPLAEEYRPDIASPIADIKNIGSSYAGTITAGLFLEEFVEKNTWAHIDIAGPSWTDRPREYETRGGTGVMVRTLTEYLMSL